MRKNWLSSCLVVAIPLLAIFHVSAPLTIASKDQSESPKDVQYKSYTLKSSIVHVLLIPSNSKFSVSPALSPQLDTLENFAQKYQAIAVLNGGFFDPVNHKTTSYIVKSGKLVADPRLNERLINNPSLISYLDKILNRTEFRQYLCSKVRYDMALHSQPPPKNCQLINAIGAGPRLLPQITLEQEGFLAVNNGRVIRDALGSSYPNARTAVGITSDNRIIWVMVAQKSQSPTQSGMSLPALAEFMKTLGVEQAMNLDGGSSSALYYRGKSFYGKVDAKGNPVRRKIKSVLLVQPKY